MPVGNMATYTELLRRSWRRLLGAQVLVSGSHVALATAVSAPNVHGSVDLTATGVSHYSFATYAANDPIEDRFVIKSHEQRVIAAVLDGHGGWQASEFAHKELPEAIAKEFGNSADPHDPEQVASALVRAFTRTDRAFISAVRTAFQLGFGDVAKVGCCAIAAVVTPNYLVIANAGDCRAVYGQVVHTDKGHALPPALLADAKKQAAAQPSQPRIDAGYGSDGEEQAAQLPPGGIARLNGQHVHLWAVPLSDDHNARVPREVGRLQAAHPGEADIVKCHSPDACYVKGRLQPTRAIGDAYLKHSEFNAPSPLDFIDHMETAYPAGTVGSASILYGAKAADESDASAFNAAAALYARKWGRHVPAPYTPPYITATPETRILRLKAGAGGSGSGSDGSGSGSESDGQLSSSSGSMRDRVMRGGGASSSSGGSSSSSGEAGFYPASAALAMPSAFSQLPADVVADARTQRFIVLGCDGVWDVLSNEEAVRFVAADKGDRTTVSSRLVQVRALLRWSARVDV
jgi:serine/threonine protein phosphatase PrpC